MADVDTRSLPELVSNLVNNLADLVRKEGQLVRAEVSEKVGLAGKAAAIVAVGAALLLGAFLVLLQALVIFLARHMDPALASLIVGVVVGLIGAALIMAGVKAVKPEHMKPERSTRQINKDLHMMKGQPQ